MNRPTFQRCALREIPSVAEGGGFEPPVREPVRQFSKLLVSATHPSFQKEALAANLGVISLIAGAKVLHIFEPCKFFCNFFLSICNFFLFRSGIRDSNPRPSAWEANALPTELIPHDCCFEKERARTDIVLTQCFWKRADSRTRTGDPRITNALLYQLSHIGSLSKNSLLKKRCKGNTFFCNRKIFLH